MPESVQEYRALAGHRREPTGAPLVLILQPLDHHDLTHMTDELAGEMGRIMVHLGAAIEALPSVARVHVGRWGDGGSHTHVFLFARPSRMPQLPVVIRAPLAR